jgi:hypothetical protein
MPGPPPAAPIAPWHMWGSSVRLHGVQNVADTANRQNVQLARVNYRRPETWSFFLASRLVGGTSNGTAGTILYIKFVVIVGVGRSIFSTEPVPPDLTTTLDLEFFHTFRYVLGAGVVPGNQNNNRKFVTSIRTPPVDDSIVIANPYEDSSSRYVCDHLVAQDIQCTAFIELPSGTGEWIIDAEATAFFAPRVHVRPDWFTLPEEEEEGRHGRFLGTERGGT